MIEVFILIGFFWVCGWLYACGVHQGSKEFVREKGTKEAKENLDYGTWLQYVVLFFGWPHYLGYGKD